MKMLTACTFEVDDADLAVQEILDQLDLKHSLRKNSIGLLACHLDYMTDDVLKAVCDALPFDVMGMNTQLSGTPEGHDKFALSLAVLTADDVEFAAKLSPSLRDADETLFPLYYESLVEPLSSDPAMLFIFAPLLVNDLGDEVIGLIDDLSGHLPLFGSVAIDFTDHIRDPRVVFNGETYTDRLAVASIAGNFHPSFFHFTFSEDLLLEQKAIITKSEGDIIYEINEKPAIKYFESLGLAQDGQMVGTSAVPFAIDAHDGMPPAVRNIFGITPEGYIQCGGSVKQNATLSIGANEKDEVMRTAKIAADAILQKGDKNGAVLLSCATRSFALDFDEYEEVDFFRQAFQGKLPYFFAYSGGEIGPILDAGGRQVNGFHNSSLIVCTF